MKIVDFLKVSAQEYETIRLNLFVRWCEIKSTSPIEWQYLLNSNAVYQWFNMELKKKENRLMDDLNHYQSQTSSTDLVEIYVSYMKSLDALFLAPVQNKIRTKTQKQLKYEDFTSHIYLN